MDKLETRSFDQKKDLVEYVNEHGISREQIVDIFQDSDKLYVLMYFTD